MEADNDNLDAVEALHAYAFPRMTLEEATATATALIRMIPQVYSTRCLQTGPKPIS